VPSIDPAPEDLAGSFVGKLAAIVAPTAALSGMRADGPAQRASSFPLRVVLSNAARTETPQQHDGEVRSSIALLPSAYTKPETAML
jgi:hypothetical protein